MDTVEVSGRTVDEAVDRALGQLGLSRDQVDVDVVSEGRSGFLGIGSEEAVVRVTARGSSEAVGSGEEADRPARRRGRRGGRGRRRDGGARAQADTDEPPVREEAAPAVADPGDDEPPRRSEVEGWGDGGRRGDRERPGGRGPAGRSRGARRFRGTPLEGAPRIPGQPPEPPEPVAEWEDAVDLAGRTLRDMLNLLGFAETEIRGRDPETAGDGVGKTEQVFDIVALDDDTADELGGLIGRRGQTLVSLQYLLNVIVSRRLGGDHVFAVDAAGYRRRREESLVEMAREIAGEVRETGDVITLEPLSAAERRIIHLAIEQEEGVRSESVGEGDERQVEVLPE